MHENIPNLLFCHVGGVETKREQVKLDVGDTIRNLLERVPWSPTERLCLGSVERRIHAITLAFWEHLYRAAKHFRHFKDRIRFCCPETKLITFSSLANEHQPLNDIVDMRKIPLLCARRDNRERITCRPLTTKGLNEGPVVARRSFSGAIRVIKICDRIREPVPATVILYQFRIRGLGPCIRSLYTTEPAIAELRRRTCINKFRFLLAPKFDNPKGAVLIKIPDERWLAK